MTLSDLDLLRDYVRGQSQEAFTTLVHRHVNLVHSAALRQVRSPQLAEEVAQSVFDDLARNAAKLSGADFQPAGSLTPWLYAVTRRTAIDVIRKESRRQLREQIATEMNAMNATTSDWTQIEPLLDDAMSALDETDRAAVLLRYFENKSLREVGATLGTSEDAAQKRVSRAVERLREFFAKRGVTVGVSGLVVVISANAVQAAPVGLAITISTAAALAGTTIATTATATAAKTIAMTTLQKTIIGTTLAVAVGAGVYEAQQASTWKAQADSLRQQQQQQQPPQNNEQNQQITADYADAIKRLAALRDENARLNSNTLELLKLRGEVAVLKNENQDLARQSSASKTDATELAVRSWLNRTSLLKQQLEQTPDARIPELRFLTDHNWLDVAKNYDLKDEKEFRQAFSQLRQIAENTVAHILGTAMKKYSEANPGSFASDVSQLKPYLETPLEDSILQRYVIYPGDTLQSIKLGGDWLITLKAPVDVEFDQRLAIGPNGVGSTGFKTSEIVDTLSPAIKAYMAANNGKMPTDPAQIVPYITTSEQQAALQKAVEQLKAQTK